MDNPLILQLLQKLHQWSCANKTIHLCWIPSHIGIRGNEAVDMAAIKGILRSRYYCQSSPLYRLKISHQSFYFKQMAGALLVLP